MIPPHPHRPLGARVRTRLCIAAALGTVLALAAAPATAVGPAPTSRVETGAAPSAVSGVTLVAGGFSDPLFVTHAFDERLFVVERTGRIRILKPKDGGWVHGGTFLDIRDLVSRGHSEQGLLGLAFHPDYATNGRFYVDYTDLRGDTVIAEFRRASARRADPASRRTVLTVKQPYDNHNGGWIGFWGENLYIALGDGGSGGDPQGNGQDLGSRLGKILRIDPLDPDGAGRRRYRVPPDNPFVGKPGRDEIWAYGLRNPWRDSFDRETGDLWLGDVGQDRYEEIDRAGNGKGRNFGWDRVEGRHLYPSGALCTSGCRTLPVVEVKHAVRGADNCSIVGGYVSRRPGADLEGRYLFGDTCSGRIWDIPADLASGRPGAPLDTSLYISSFGEGQDGRIYIADLAGAIYRVNGS